MKESIVYSGALVIQNQIGAGSYLVWSTIIPYNTQNFSDAKLLQNAWI